MDVEASGRSVEEAIERALAELGITRDDAEIEVLDSGARGMLWFGGRDARVRVRVRGTPAAAVHQLTEELLRAMGVPGTVRVREQEGAVAVEISGQDLGALIGRHGTTLEAIGVLLEAMVARRTGSRARIAVDVGGYRERRRVALDGIARHAADRAVHEGREIMLEPMTAHERRIVHTMLADHPLVTTFSRGEGTARRVVVAPKAADPSPAPSPQRGEGMEPD